jgi:hypothetical protein
MYPKAIQTLKDEGSQIWRNARTRSRRLTYSWYLRCRDEDEDEVAGGESGDELDEARWRTGYRMPRLRVLTD